MTPPAERPNSAEYWLVCTANSWIASIGGVMERVPLNSMLLDTPSMMKLLASAGAPPTTSSAPEIAACRPLALPPLAPGVSVAIVKIFRLIIGRFCNCSRVIRLLTSDVAVLIAGAAACT